MALTCYPFLPEILCETSRKSPIQAICMFKAPKGPLQNTSSDHSLNHAHLSSVSYFILCLLIKGTSTYKRYYCLRYAIHSELSPIEYNGNYSQVSMHWIAALNPFQLQGPIAAPPLQGPPRQCRISKTEPAENKAVKQTKSAVAFDFRNSNGKAPHPLPKL